MIAELTAFLQVQAHVVEHNLCFWWSYKFFMFLLCAKVVVGVCSWSPVMGMQLLSAILKAS